MTRKFGGMRTRAAGNPSRARAAPAETQELYVSAVPFGMIVHAAAEFGMSVDELAEEAVIAHLKVKAGQLFEREFQEAKLEADQSNQPSLKRYEFERDYREPYWAKDPNKKPPPPAME